MPEIVIDKNTGNRQPKIDVRPWGSFKQYTHNEVSTVKLIYVKRGQELSYQSHENRDEMWVCVRGKVKVTLDDKNFYLTEDNKVFIPRGSKHRMKCPQTCSEAVILEVAFGEFDESDIKRYKDRYGRN